MRRLSDSAEMETLDNARRAYDNYSDSKHNRGYVREYDADLERNLENVVMMIADETWVPEGYTPKVIFNRKVRVLAKAPIGDHVTESASILPYEKSLYDYSTWRAPAVKPGLGTHAFLRFLRNELYSHTQSEMMYNIPMDIHHYFPLMSHQVLKDTVDRVVKPGKFRRFLYKVIDSYPGGIPLGIKVSQILGQIYLAPFDRMAMRFFRIAEDPDKLAYWTRRYVEAKIFTARTPDEFRELCRGPSWLAGRFHRYAREGLPFYFRFVDNILLLHEDKAVLHIAKELSIMHLTRDFLCRLNTDYNVRPTWAGIRMVGYTFLHSQTMLGKQNKKELCREVHRLRRKGYGEEDIRIRQASRLGYAKHANSIHLFKKIGMEKSLGKIIKSRRVRAPFPDMNGSQKVKFSSIVNKEEDDKVKILLIDYRIVDSKIDKDKILVQVEKSDGAPETVEKSKPNKALAIRFKKILKTFVTNDEEEYVFEKKKDERGDPTLIDAEYYSFTGSKILIDQAVNDFTIEDLPCPTVIRQFTGRNGQTFVKFT